MAEKQDYYQVLGVLKTASLEEIKAAYKKIAMKCHPDMQRNKTDAEKKVAAEKFQQATEAHDVLTTQSKRDVYDRFGHRGLENLAKSGSSGTSGTDVTPPPTRRMHTNEDIFDFFASESKKQGPSDQSGQPRKSREERDREAAEARAKAREEERRQRQAAREAASAPAPSSLAETFNDVADKVSEAARHVKDVPVPADVLERLSRNLKELVSEIDRAIDRSKKSGPGPK